MAIFSKSNDRFDIDYFFKIDGLKNLNKKSAIEN